MADSTLATLTDERRLATLLVRIGAARRALEQHARLNAADLRLLWLLSERQPRTLRDISESLNLEQSTVNRQVNAALRDGLLTRAREAGSPAWQIRPTEKGLRAFEDEVDRVHGLYRDGLAELGERSQEFLELLEAFVVTYAEAVRRHIEP